MIPVVGQTLRWVLSLGKKFTLVVPLQTLVIVLLTLVSQISALLASFLPLKVVVLLGSERIPRYFPDALAVLDKDLLIGLLCLSTLAFYGLHVLAERLIRWFTAWGTKRLLQRSHKMTLFENQEGVAQEGYLRFSRALAGGVFITLALALLGWFYPIMAGVLVVYVLLAWLVLCLLFAVSTAFQEQLTKNLIGVLNTLAALGFFFAFAYLVVDFIFLFPPSVIIAIVGLLLSRQVMNRMAGMVGDVASLQRQQPKLDALFFHGKVLLPQLPDDKAEFWTMLQPAQRDAWLKPVLQEFTSWQGGRCDVRWQQSGMTDTAAFLVETDTGDYWVKVFDAKRSSLALHESTLLMDTLPNMPAMPLLGVTEIGNVSCLVYQMPRGLFLEPKPFKAFVPLIWAALWRVQLPNGLVERYCRSRPVLWQRLRLPLLQRMQVAVSAPEQQQQLDALAECFDSIIKQLTDLPLVLSNKSMAANQVLQTEQGDPVLLNWGQWALEPMGAGFPYARFEISDVLIASGDSIQVDESRIRLAALMSALELACNSQRYLDALALLPDVLNLIASSCDATDEK